MNWNQIQGNWRQLKGKIRERWGRLTNDEVDEIAGSREQLVGKLQNVYGITQEEAENQIDSFCRTCDFPTRAGASID